MSWIVENWPAFAIPLAVLISAAAWFIWRWRRRRK